MNKQNIFEFISGNMADYRAIIYKDKEIMFSDFLDYVNNASNNFARLGLKSGDVVMICCRNCPQLAVSFYALARLGVITYLVSNMFSNEKINELIKKTNSVLLISDNPNHLVNISTLIINLDFHLNNEQKNSFEETIYYINKKKYSIEKKWNLPEDDICFLNSSGTTGTEKIVRLSSCNLNSSALNIEPYVLPKENGVFINVLPFYHCFALCNVLHFCLRNHITILMENSFNPDRFIKQICKYKATFSLGVPYLYDCLRNSDFFVPKNLKSLRICFCGGEKLNKEIINAYNDFFSRNNSSCRLIEGYGMTETSAACTGLFTWEYLVNKVGKIFSPIDYYVDNNGQLSKKNCYGELLLSGDSIMNGYLDGDVDPFVYLDGKKFFRTKDYVYIDSEGYVEIIDRIKKIIIKKGENINPNAIMEELKKLSFIDDVAIFEVNNRGIKNKVKAIIVINKVIDNCEEKINKYLNEKLGEFYLIDEFEIKEKL